MSSTLKQKNKPKSTRLSARDHYTQVDIEEAMKEHAEQGISIRTAARNHGIPEATLRHKLSGYHPVSMKMGPKTLLTEAEEEAIVNYIKVSCDRARPVTKSNVLKAISTILKDEREGNYKRALPPSFRDDCPREKWWRLFRERHPNITFRTPESLTTARKNVSKGSVYQWFQDTLTYFTDNDLLHVLNDPARNFNIDESGFSLSPKQGKVLAHRGEKAVFEEVSSKQKCNITVLAIVCADGRVPPPMIIYPRKRINPMMSEEFPEDIEFTVGKSDKGYITYETLYEYLCNSFNDWLNSQNIQRPVIIWTDWHETRNNYYLAKTLNEQQIILYGLPPNTTHFLQPLDVSVFGPLKKGWAKEAKEWEEQHNDEMITQVKFAKVFLPAYMKYVTADNIKSGFRKCGLVPFNPDSPDYYKLAAGAAQRASGTCIFEGINQGGKVEASVQAVPHVYHRGVQTAHILQVTTAKDRRDKFRYEDSLCDMVLDYHGYSSLRNYYRIMPFHSASAVLDFQSPTVSQKDPSTSGVSTKESSNVLQDAISPYFSEHLHYPERRLGKGPKKITSALDRVYAISSQKMFTHFKKQKEDKEKQEEEKQKKRLDKQKQSMESAGSKRKSQTHRPPKKRCSTRVDVDGETSSNEEEANSVHDTSDESLNLDDGGDFGIKLPLEEPVDNSWVGVKIERVQASTSGRQQTPSFEVFIGKVISSDDGGLTVSFLRQKSETFYYFPDVEDSSYPVHRNEVVVLDKPGTLVQNRLQGFTFPSGIRSSITSYFQK